MIRLSGPDAVGVAGALLKRRVPTSRTSFDAEVEVLGAAVECRVLVMPGPRSYTGEDVVELHLPGSPLLLEHVLSSLRRQARDATPGEFTRRAVEGGRMDLAEAEAVLELIHAAGAAEGRRALEVLRGGLREGIEQVRGALLDARAMVEAGLDFTEGETGDVAPEAWLPGLAAASARLTELSAALPAAAPGGELLLLGASNAGKSTLCNALAGRQVALVSAAPGTTRDILAADLAPGVRILDAPGDLSAGGAADASAIELRDRLATRASGAVLVVDLTDPVIVSTELPIVAVVLTKRDLAPAAEVPAGLPSAPRFVVSSAAGDGIEALSRHLRHRASAAPVGSGQRMRDLLDRVGDAVDRAREAALVGVPEEAIALDLTDAVVELDQLRGQGASEEVLDRVFGRFCLGK